MATQSEKEVEFPDRLIIDEFFGSTLTSEPPTIVSEESKEVLKASSQTSMNELERRANSSSIPTSKAAGKRSAKKELGVEGLLFDYPPLKSKRDEVTTVSEISSNHHDKLLLLRNGLLILKLCKPCQSSLFADKNKFHFDKGRVCVEINLCDSCVRGNVTANDCADSARSIYESEYFKLVKIHFGVILMKLCQRCEQLLHVNINPTDGRVTAKIGFCRTCCQYNMNTCDALTAYFPYRR